MARNIAIDISNVSQIQYQKSNPIIAIISDLADVPFKKK